MPRWPAPALSAPRPSLGLYVRARSDTADRPYPFFETEAFLTILPIRSALSVLSALNERILCTCRREAPRALVEYLEGGQALLQLGDLDGKLRRAGVEGRDAGFQLVRSCCETGDLVGDLALENSAGAAEPQVSPQSADGGGEGDQGPEQDDGKHDQRHIDDYRNTAPPAFTNVGAVLKSSPRRGVEQSGSSSGS